MIIRKYYAAVLLLAVILIWQLPAEAAVKVFGVGQAQINPGTFNPHELSGIAYSGVVLGNTYRYLAVSDSQKKVFGLDIKINKKTGAVESAKVVSELNIPVGTDLEGIALPSSKTMLLSDEVGPAIRSYSRTDATLLDTLAMPDVLANQRPNKSLESLAVDARTGSIWTANEEALAGDGNIAGIGTGTTVRFFKFNKDYSPAGQFAYKVDPIESAFLQKEVSGVADIAVLPDGNLIVLERELDGNGFRSRLYLTSATGATDVTSLQGLVGQTYRPMKKTLLWEKRFGFSDLNNYEGMGLGPVLQDDSMSLLLVSDDNNTSLMEQTLYALKVQGLQKTRAAVPEPSNLVGIALGVLLLLSILFGSKIALTKRSNLRSEVRSQ